MSLLRAHNLAGSYDGRRIFSGVNLNLDAGVYALTGANGTGKSTLLRLLAGAQRPGAGNVIIAGHDLVREPLAAKRALSYVPDEAPAYPFMTGRDFLDFVRAAKNADVDPVVDALTDAFGLGPHLDQRFDAISLGTQKKLLLAAGWIGRPRVLLLDEPSNALDAGSRTALIARLQTDRDHLAILFASHDSDFVRDTRASVVTVPELAKTYKA